MAEPEPEPEPKSVKQKIPFVSIMRLIMSIGMFRLYAARLVCIFGSDPLKNR